MDPRFGQASSTHRQVQERQEDLRMIEQSITELANMIQIMSVHVEEHGDMVDVILKKTDETRDNTRAA
jgi:t-SNARE complex subunit (syntaxin)